MKAKRILSVLLAVVFMFSFMNISVMAEDADVTTAADLQNAFNAGGETKLGKDINVTENLTIPSGVSVTLDLNGYTVSGEFSVSATSCLIKNEGTLVVEDSSDAKSGKLTYKSTNPSANNSYSTSTIINTGNLTVNGGTIENTTTGTGAIYAIDTAWYTSDVSITVTDGTIKSTSTAIRQTLFSDKATSTVNISGGTVSGDYAGLQIHNFGTAACLAETKISGGTLEGTYAFYTYYTGKDTATGTDIEITGGTFNGYVFLYNGNAGSDAYPLKVAIKDGTFEDGAYVYTTDASGNEVPISSITGGTYTDDYSEYCVDGYEMKSNDDGTYGVAISPEALPNAEVKNLGVTTVAEYSVYNLGDKTLKDGDGTPINLSVAMEFIANDSVEEAKANAFGDYTTDFYIKVDGIENGSFVANGCYLAGNYGTFGWIMIPLDGFMIEDGKTYPVITSVGFDFDYATICESVKDFKCGIYFSDEVLEANPELNVSLELGLSETYEEALAAESFITVDEPYVYDAEELKGYVAEVNGTKYKSLQDAIDEAVSGATIKLLSNITTSNIFTVADGRTVTLDLAGFEISATDGISPVSQGVINVERGGSLTINDTVGTGAIKSNNISYAAVMVTTSKDTNTAGTAKLTVNGGTLEGQWYGITGNGSRPNTEITINGGTITSTQTYGLGIFHPQVGTLTVTGGIIKGDVGVEMRSGTLNMTAGEIISTSDAVETRVYDNGATAMKGIAVMLSQHTTNNPVVINITGGTLSGKCALYQDRLIPNYTPSTNISATIGADVVVNGDVKANEKGFEMTGDATTGWTLKEVEPVAEVGGVQYTSLADAVAAAKAGETVTLLGDASGAGVVVNKSVTIDFGGYTYTLTEPVGSANTVTNGFQLLKNNDIIFKNGTLKVADDAADKFYILVQNYSNLTVENMTLDGTNLDKYSKTDGDSYTLSNNSGTVNITGATNITANNEGDLAYAFDVYYNKNYAAPTVNVSTTGKIDGNIEVSEGVTLVISNGTYTADYSEYCVDGYVMKQNADGTYGVVEETAVELFDIYGTNMTLGNSLALNFFVETANLNGTDYYALITREYADNREELVDTVPYSEWVPNETKYMKFTYNGIAAKEMGDNINVQIFNASDNTPASNVFTESLKSYAFKTFSKGTPLLKTAMVDMLNYGSASQAYFGYNTNNLVNADLDDELANLATSTPIIKNSNDKFVTSEAFYGRSLILKNNIILNFYFTNVVTTDMRAVITFADHYGNEKTINMSGNEFGKNGSYTYVPVDDLVLADGYQVVTCTIYDGETEVATAQGSVDAYLQEAIEKRPDVELYGKILKFISSAYTYFHH